MPPPRRSLLHAAQSKVIVVGDIGGTNARLGMWRVNPKTHESEEIFHQAGTAAHLAPLGVPAATAAWAAIPRGRGVPGELAPAASRLAARQPPRTAPLMQAATTAPPLHPCRSMAPGSCSTLRTQWWSSWGTRRPRV